MGETDTLSVESVRASVNLPDRKTTPCKDFEEKNFELSIMLEKTEFERDIYMNECRETKTRIDELESKIKEMDEQFSETLKIREEYYNVMSELNSAQEDVVVQKEKVLEAQDAKHEALKQAELMETALNIEKQKTEELQGHVSVINDTILCMQLAALEAKKENIAVLSKKQSEIVSATKLVQEAQRELETIRSHQPGSMQTLEKELIKKNLLIDSLQLEVQKANDLQKSAQKATSEAVDNVNQLIADMELLVTENSDKGVQIKFLETELTQLKLDYISTNKDVEIANEYRECLKRAVETADKDSERLNKDVEKAENDTECLNKDVEMLTCKLESIKNELDEISGKEAEAQVEIVFLKSELHKGISKTAAAAAAEERAKLENLTIRQNIKQLESEAEEAYKEIRRLKEEADKRAATGVTDNNVIVSVEEYNALVEKANKEETMTDNRYELETLKKDLEITTARIGEFRTRAEQAAFRAEAAEKGKAALEEHIRRLREQKERRKFAHQAFKEASMTPTYNYKQDLGLPPKTHPPLGKILNMKF